MSDVKMAGLRVADMVRGMMNTPRARRTTKEESDLAVHLRTNESLYLALVAVIDSRIRGRESLPVPSDPLDCKSILERNDELRKVLSQLEFLYRSPVEQGADETGEQPAA